jgi:hypothetical protein
VKPGQEAHRLLILYDARYGVFGKQHGGEKSAKANAKTALLPVLTCLNCRPLDRGAYPDVKCIRFSSVNISNVYIP